MRFSTLAALALSLTFSSVSFASGGAHAPELEIPDLKPAARYSGSSPIDLSHGLKGNNGTYGAPNPAYEAWAKSKKVTPGMNDAPYPYELKDRLLESLNEQVMWGETAIANWKNNPSKKAEVSAYSKQAAETMDPLLAKLKDATKAAKGAGTSDWATAEAQARKAAAEFRAGYKSLHNNVANH